MYWAIRIPNMIPNKITSISILLDLLGFLFLGLDISVDLSFNFTLDGSSLFSLLNASNLLLNCLHRSPIRFPWFVLVGLFSCQLFYLLLHRHLSIPVDDKNQNHYNEDDNHDIGLNRVSVEGFQVPSDILSSRGPVVDFLWRETGLDPGSCLCVN